MHDDSKEKLTKAEAENDRLKLEIERLHQRIQKMALSVPNHKGLQDKGLHDSQNPWDPFQSLEPEFVPHSVQVAELTDKLEHTQTELHRTQTELQHTQTELQHTKKELEQTKGELKQVQERVHMYYFSICIR